MNTIWKYNLEITDYQRLKVNEPAIPLSVLTQGNQIVAYFLVKTEGFPTVRDVYIRGTGQPLTSIEASTPFQGSVTTHNGSLVWHIFISK